MNVLIVDDHATFRNRLRVMLEAEGVNVVAEAADGASAFQAVDTVDADVILLDVHLPDIDGFEIARRLCERAVPAAVILISSRDVTDFAGSLASSPAHGFISKADLTPQAISELLLERRR